MSDQEEEMTVSSYSVAELWQRLPLHLVKDIFGYFSLHDIGQKPRVSPVWKLLLSNLAFFNHGILFIDSCDVRYAKRLLSWLTEGTIKHLVLQGAPWHVYELQKQLIEYCAVTAASKLTFCNAKFGIYEFREMEGLLYCSGTGNKDTVLGNIGRIDFVNCTFEVSFSLWVLPGKDEKSSVEPVKWKCSYSIKYPIKTFSRETDAELQHEFERRTCHLHEYYFHPEGAEDIHKLGHVREEVYVQGFLEWCLDSKDVARASLWPYPDPEKQLQWLKTALDELDEDTRLCVSEAFDLYDSDWRAYRLYAEVPQGGSDDPDDHKTFRTAKEEWHIKEDIYWEKWNENNYERELHKLDLLDCAFLAALLNITPGVSESPYPFDSHLKIEPPVENKIFRNKIHAIYLIRTICANCGYPMLN